LPPPALIRISSRKTSRKSPIPARARQKLITLTQESRNSPMEKVTLCFVSDFAEHDFETTVSKRRRRSETKYRGTSSPGPASLNMY
jgi:hypothetical protein